VRSEHAGLARQRFDRGRPDAIGKIAARGRVKARRADER
jgi:hypothetical protein